MIELKFYFINSTKSYIFVVHKTSFVTDMTVQDSDSDVEVFDLLDLSMPGKVVDNISISCTVEVNAL